jgi:hypothetical protein
MGDSWLYIYPNGIPVFPMFHSMSGVMFLNSSLICTVSSSTVMILNVHTLDLTIPHI